MTDPTYGDRDDQAAELLRRALREEAATVDTDPTALQRIRRRTEKQPSLASTGRRGWVVGAVSAAAAAAAVITGIVLVGQTGDEDGTPIAGTPSPSDSESPPDSTPVQTPASLAVALTYLGPPENGWRLTTERQEVGAVTGADPEIEAVRAFLADSPADPDYRSGWPAGLDVEDVTRSGGTVQVDLTGPAGDIEPDPALSAEARSLAVQALARTAGAQVGDTAELTYNGAPMTQALGVDLPVTVAPDIETRAFISIVDILDGQPLDNPVRITVSGNVFEGTVNWQLLDSAEAVIDDGFVTTSMGQWTEATIKLGTLQPGTYTIRCLEYSAENGDPMNIDDKTFVVE